MQSYVANIEEMHKLHPRAMRGYGFDSTVALVRIGNVRLRAGDAEGAKEFFTQATRRCTDAGWKGDCSEARVREIVDRIDRSSVLYQIGAKHGAASEETPNQGMQADAQENARD